jgi:hypothetical protein
VGFIRVSQFSEQTTEDLKKVITDLSTQAGDKLKSFIAGWDTAFAKLEDVPWTGC